MATKRKHKSGALKRKERKQRESAQRGEMVVSAQGWGQLYQAASQQWDEKAIASELPLYGVPPPVLVRAVQAAITALEQGAFYAPTILYDGMMRDDRVSAKCEERIDRLVGSDLELEPADDSPLAAKVAEDAKSKIDVLLPADQLTKLMRYGLGLSVGVAQVISDRDDKSRTPTLKVWNNRNLRYDWLLRSFMMVTENKGEIPIKAGDPGWVVYEPYGPHGWLDSAKIRSISIPWLIRTWVRQWWAREREVHGQPIRAGIIPIKREPRDERYFLSQLANLGSEAVIRLPQGDEGNKFDLKLIESAGRSWEGFEKLLAHCDDSIAIVYLGQKQSTTGQGGLGSQENAGESTTLRITRKDSRVGNVLREQYLKPWAADNWGDPELAPRLRWDIEPPADESATAKTDLSVGQSLIAFKTAGAPIDQRAYLVARGYSDQLLTPEQHAAEKALAIKQAQTAMGGVVDGAPDDKQDEQE